MQFHRYLALFTLLAAASLRANVVLEWNAQMMSAVRVDNSGPTLSSRNLAILHLAIFDAVNSVYGDAQPYLGVLQTPGGEASVEAAVAAVGREIMSALYPSLEGTTEALYETEIGALPPGSALTNGIALGLRAADRMLDARVGDGSTTQVPYIPSADPGQWRRTPPFFRPPLDPHWRYVTPFAIPGTEAFVPPPPPPLDSADYAEAFNEVKLLGAKDSTVRTREQSEIATFWSDFSYTAMPPGHWHEIAAVIAREVDLSLAETARLFGLLSLAQADGAIVCWEAKFRYNTWRPITAIQRAEEDGNPATDADLSWNHFLISPPFPEYTSGHSTFSGASARVLQSFFGTDSMRFTARSDALPGVIRSFTSFTACAEEVGMSRIYGGIHFQFANREGKRAGRRIADHVSQNFLLRNDTLPTAHVEAVAAGGVQVRVHGHIGRECAVEATSDLLTWSEVGRGLARVGGFLATDSRAEGPVRFYRVAEY